MRDLNECQAEVFRRSEKRIKERKQRRNHILMACIPLVLCIAMLGAFVLPLNMNDKSAPESSNENYAGGTEAVQDGMGTLFAGSVQVSGNGLSHSYGSVADVQKIIGLLNEIIAVPETNEGNDMDNATAEDSSSTDLKDEYRDKGYKILVKRSDGSSTEYLLVSSLLIDQATQQEFSIDEDTYNELKEVLGIPYY